ncbi:hypothetical protein llap_4941 [Limosa lapponica baueri]|uniref:Uncharacterized protein n=1 Tax=Limosa lapponica baueri TaxID=1758121 RepID=A0A2I0UFG6_LIMLA|nr:hypothetical protein llap_4941 [Limosa lapponica baueri]
MSEKLLHYMARCLFLLDIKAAAWRGTRERNVRNLWQVLARFSSGNIPPDNGSNRRAKRHNPKHEERQAVQPSRSTAFIVPIKDPLALVDGLPPIWLGFELGPLGAETKDQVSNFN